MPEMSEKWTDAQLRFIEWMSLPKTERKPKTYAQFAELTDIQVDERTLYRWKRLPGFMDEVARVAKEFMKDDVADVLGAIRNNAKKGSVAHVNMFLAMIGMGADVEAAGKGSGGNAINIQVMYGDGDS